MGIRKYDIVKIPGEGDQLFQVIEVEEIVATCQHVLLGHTKVGMLASLKRVSNPRKKLEKLQRDLEQRLRRVSELLSRPEPR